MIRKRRRIGWRRSGGFQDRFDLGMRGFFGGKGKPMKRETIRAIKAAPKRHVRRGGSFAGLSSIVVLTQHLAVRRYRLPALAPRLDVVGFHLADVELLFIGWVVEGVLRGVRRRRQCSGNPGRK
jgi:hypothetical protein